MDHGNQQTAQPVLTTVVSIILQSTILSCLVSRIAVSALNSPVYSHLSLYERWQRVPGSTRSLWALFLGLWAYAIAVDILQHGTDLSHTGPCTVATFICISFYGVAKSLILLFLNERAHVIRSKSRREDKLYWFNLGTILLVFAIWIPSLLQPEEVKRGARCFVDVKHGLLIATALWDGLVTASLTIQFVIPVVKITKAMQHISAPASQNKQRQLLAFARRTVFGAIAGFVVSVINLTQLVVRSGKEDVWACLLTCSFDILINCVVLHFITNGRVGTDESLKKATEEECEFHGPSRSHDEEAASNESVVQRSRSNQEETKLEEVSSVSTKTYVMSENGAATPKLLHITEETQKYDNSDAPWGSATITSTTQL